MSIPDFQTIMLPLLQFSADGHEHSLSEAVTALANQFKLSDADKAELLPSGSQSRFNNRVGWSQTYLNKAGLLVKTGRAKFQITKRGLGVLDHPPTKIDIQYLNQFEEFIQFKNASSTPSEHTPATALSVEQETTPQEVLESNFQLLRSTLAQELLERIKSCPPHFFEIVVIDLLVAMGYGGSRKEAGQRVGKTGDGGIDGIIKEDKLGLDTIYVQAKRWQSTVGRPVVQTFAGSLDGYKARKGVFITSSTFSAEARDYVKRIEKKIVLIDGDLLAQLMIEHDVGVAQVTTYIIKKIDTDYFEGE